MRDAYITTRDEFVEHLQSNTKLNLMVVVTRECVLRCRYCYARDPNHRPENRMIADDLLEKVISDAFDVRQRHIDFEWTGGEALLGGRPFFEKVLALQRRHSRNGKTYSNCVQTSGAIYDEELYDFLIDNKVTLSLTIDGPRDLHELNRPGRSAGAFDDILRSQKYIRARQGWCGVLCTLTKASAGRFKEIADFYADNGIPHWHTNTYICDPGKPVSEEELGLTPEEVASYFKGQFDYLLEKFSDSFGEGSLETIMKLLTGVGCGTKCSQGARCLTNFVSVDDLGNATLCPKFVGYEDFRFGNIRESAMSDLVSCDNPVLKRLIDERLAAINDCERSRCAYLSLCKGGCPYYSYLNGRDGSVARRNVLCKARYDICEHVDRRLGSYGIKTATAVSATGGDPAGADRRSSEQRRGNVHQQAGWGGVGSAREGPCA
ncbi:MAG: radical SAM protein [Proteobacteria bacterium]|nr:radical SAM protein [Pseudomonadota bacterium]